MRVDQLVVLPQRDGTIHYQRASYIEDGWSIVFDGGVYGIYYIPGYDQYEEFEGTRETLEDALVFAESLDQVYS
jgi:hypothetical protein